MQLSNLYFCWDLQLKNQIFDLIMVNGILNKGKARTKFIFRVKPLFMQTQMLLLLELLLKLLLELLLLLLHVFYHLLRRGQEARPSN